MRWIICLLLCIVCSTMNMARAAEPAAEQTPDQALEPILKELRANDITRAFAEMLILGMPQQSWDDAEELITKLKKFRQNCGKPLEEIELIDTTRVGSRVVRMTYIEYFEKRLLVWKFTLYRGSKQWRYMNVSWTHEIDDLLEKSKQLEPKPKEANH